MSEQLHEMLSRHREEERARIRAALLSDAAVEAGADAAWQAMPVEYRRALPTLDVGKVARAAITAAIKQAMGEAAERPDGLRGVHVGLRSCPGCGAIEGMMHLPGCGHIR